MFTARIVFFVISRGLVLAAIGLCWDGSNTSLVGPALALSPAVGWVIGQINPSGPEIASGVLLAAAAIRLGRERGAVGRGWWMAVAVGSIVLGLARPSGPGWLALYAVLFAVEARPSGVRLAIRRSPRWSEAYGIERPTINASLRNAAGTSLKDWAIVLEPDSTHVVDIRAVCGELGVALPFEGQLLLRIAGEKLWAGRPLQVFAEYLRDDGEATGVHGRYGLMKIPAAQVVGNMRVEALADRRTAVIVTNPYDGPGGPQPLRAELTILSADSRRRSLRLPSVPPMGTSRVYLDEAFPNLQSFLGGRPGHFFLKLPCPSSRIANFIEYDNGLRVANHGTIDRTFDQGTGMPADWTRSRPVASTLVICDDNRDTVLSFSNNWGPITSDYGVTTTVYSLAGKLIATDTQIVGHLRFSHLSVRDLLAASGVTGRTVAHAEVMIRPTGAVVERPAQFDVLLGQYRGGRLVAEVQVGAEFINGEVPPGVALPDIRRPRTFGRVRVGDGLHSRVFIGHPSGSRVLYENIASPVLTLVDMTSTRKATWQGPDLPPHAALLVDIEEAFPEARELLGPSGSGTVRIRDTNARLFGYYMTETDGAATFPLCHLIGG